MKNSGMPKKSMLMAIALVALAATSGFAVTVLVPNLVFVSTDGLINLPQVAGGPPPAVVPANFSASRFTTVVVNRPANIYVVSASGNADNDGAPNQLNIFTNVANVNGVLNAFVAATPLATGATATTFSQYLVFADGTPAADPAAVAPGNVGGDCLAVLTGIGRP